MRLRKTLAECENES